VATTCLGHAEVVLCPDPSLVPGPLTPCLPLLLLAGCKPRDAGSEGLPATHNHPVDVQAPCLGLSQSFFHEEIALGALSRGKKAPAAFNTLWKGSVASRGSSRQLQLENWVSKTKTDAKGLT